MTIPEERTRAVKEARNFLVALLYPKETPKVPKSVRQWAARVLRHFPHDYDMDTSAKKLPSIWGKN
jgi:hypothetical protein